MGSLATAQQNAAQDTITAAVNAGTPPGLLKLYSGTPPTNVGDALSGNTLLSTLPFSNPAFGSASTGVSTANAITSDTNAAATGTGSFGRITNAAGTAIRQVTVGTSGADVNLSSVSIVAGGTVAVSSLTWSHAAS